MSQFKKLLPSTLIFKRWYPGPVTGSIAITLDIIAAILIVIGVVLSSTGFVILAIDFILYIEETLTWINTLGY